MRRNRAQTNPWPIRKWFLDHQSHPWPTEAEYDDLVASSSRPRHLVQKYLSGLRTGNINPHSKHAGKPSYVIQEWFRNNLQDPYADEAQMQTLTSATELSKEEVAKRLAYLRRVLIPPASNPRMSRELPDSISQFQSLPRRSPDDSSSSRKEGRRTWPGRPRGSKTAIPHDEATQNREETETLGKRYQCTACSSSFSNRIEWTSHENTIHGYRTTEWICMADGIQGRGSNCDFCSKIIESTDHLEQHKASLCAARPPHRRTFSEFKMLKRHIQVWHMKNASKEEKKMVTVPHTWERPVVHIDPSALWCGFCQVDFKSIESRMRHVARHFEAGETMSDWVDRLSTKD